MNLEKLWQMDESLQLDPDGALICNGKSSSQPDTSELCVCEALEIRTLKI